MSAGRGEFLEQYLAAETLLFNSVPLLGAGSLGRWRWCSAPSLTGLPAAPSSGAGLTSFRHVHVLSVDIALLEMISYCLLIICFVKSVTKPDILTSLSTTPNSRPLSFSMLAGMTRIADYESMEHLGASRYLLTFVSAADTLYTRRSCLDYIDMYPQPDAAAMRVGLASHRGDLLSTAVLGPVSGS
ncbi:uncharacterized protein QC763_0030910 [Podospora pseudopauciseta]|uniref:Uncharacterized protein n=1 Tax=Podospora pseudopauciseta TaxID=2093780 RepID=A0ABR0HMZ1_9PEZI|nr:hypothetical protein QC763_0030910 [Podospora pseudopauciseta]